MKTEHSVPKRRHIKFRGRGITQKKEYNIRNTAKVWNQERQYPFASHKESEMYVTALLFFNIVFLQFHMPFLAIHKLPGSIRKGFRLLPYPCMHRFFHFFVNAKPTTTYCLFRWTKGLKVAWCEIETVRWMWQNLKLEVSNCLYCCGLTMDGENCGCAREQFWTVVFFCCELQISFCMMPSISATSGTAILPPSWMRTLARPTWSWLRDIDGLPVRASSDTSVLPHLNVSTHSKKFLWLILATAQLNAQILVF